MLILYTIYHLIYSLLCKMWYIILYKQFIITITSIIQEKLWYKYKLKNKNKNKNVYVLLKKLINNIK